MVAVLLILLPSPVWATTYYLATAAGGGSDSNSGTLPSVPWLTPNHPVNCGDVILASAGTYSASNFSSGNWGTVTCAAGNNVAWLQCATFDTCKISASSTNGMKIGKSYWGIQGWEVTTSGAPGSCFAVQPASGVLHHIIFANNVANGCISSGFTTANTGTSASTDYIVIVGNIIWNAAQTTALCDSGVTIYEPIASDTLPGTHIYIAGNFSFDNETPTNCSSGSATYDGEGIALDSIDFGQGGGHPYTQQIVVDNNISVYNGGYGLATTGSGNTAPVYFRHNTLYGNLNATNTSATTCGELAILGYPNLVTKVQATQNLVMTQGATACSGSVSLYAIYVLGGDTTDSVHSNFLYSAAGHNEGSSSSGSFAFGSNISGTNPSFANPVDPGAPSCSGKIGVVDCMSSVIANFTPITAAAMAFGYQIPGTTPVYDPLFPQWLCNVNLPLRLVTMGCLTQSSLPAPPHITSVTVQ